MIMAAKKKEEHKHAEHRDFTLSYLGCVMGEGDCSSDYSLAWSIGKDYVLALTADGIVELYGTWDNHDAQMYQIIGYCNFHNIPCILDGLE